MTEPDASALETLASRLGFSLTAEERQVLPSRVAAALATSDRFMGAALELRTLPMLAPERPPGFRPSIATDPYRAWLWRCQVGDPNRAGPLNGLRVGLKDHIALAGHPLTFAADVMADLVADVDATVVTRVLAAGAQVVGKLNMDNFSSASFGLGGYGDGVRVLNPHDPTRLAGGSSSGAAAAVAAGECDIAVAGDQAGSIRVPAAWCGVIGLKPTFGLVPHTGIISASEPTIDHVGPLTRTVADLALAMSAMSGPDGEDPRQDPRAPLPDFAAAMEGDITGVRIGLLTEGFDPAGPSEVDQLVRAAASGLAGRGATVGEVSIPSHLLVPDAYDALTLEGAALLWPTNWVGAFTKGYLPEHLSAAIGRMGAEHADQLPPNIKLNFLVAALRRQRYAGAVYARAQNARPALTAAYDRALESFDVLLMPTAPMTAPSFREPDDALDAVDSTVFGGRSGAQLVGIARNTLPFNYTGHPALSLPCGIDQSGLPVGMQLVARRWHDDVLVRVARIHEELIGPATPVRR